MGLFNKGSGRKKPVNDRLAAAAALFLAFTSLFISIHYAAFLVPLLEEGLKTPAEITEFHSGYRNIKWPIYRFITATGEQITHRDRFPMYFIRPDKGDRLTVIYDPDNPELVTADLGIWVWQGPAIFLFGFVFLSTLGVFIFRFRTKTPARR